MMPLLSSSFRPGCKQVPPPTVHSALFIVLQPFDIISLRGEMSSKDQGHTGDSVLFTELQSQPPPPPSLCRSLPLCHRDGCPGDTSRRGSPQRERPWGVLVFSPFLISSHWQPSDKSEEGCLSSSSSFIPTKISERTI